MPTTCINGLEIYYEVHGEGEPLILIHHGFGCTKMWEDVLAYFTEKYKVIMYDRRGFGKSERGGHFREYYLSEQYCDNSVKELAALLEHLDIQDRINIVGQCEGGAIGFHYTVEHPDKVKTIVAASTLCFSETTVPEYCSGKIFPSFEAADTEFQEKAKKWHGDILGPDLYSLFVQMGGAYGKEIFDLRAVLKRIQCAALVLYPDRSGLFDVEQGVLMYRSLPHGELAVIPNCGHNTYEQEPGDYQKIVLSFLERHS